MNSRADESAGALEEAMPLQELTHRGDRLLRLIEHQVMPSLSHLSPLHVWARLFDLLQESRRQACTVLGPQYQSWAPDALPERQRIERLTLGIDAAVDLVRPHTVWQLACCRAGNVVMHLRWSAQPIRTNAEMRNVLFQRGIFSAR